MAMQKLTFQDFSGGIQEATGPSDFTPRQWAELTGIVPENEVVFASQWSCQSIGDEEGFQAVIPVSSAAGVFLVGIKRWDQVDAGTLWWCKAPVSNATYTVANATVWYQLEDAENYGFASGSDQLEDQPRIEITANPDFRFICHVPVELYKYATVPTDNRANEFKYDLPANQVARAVSSGVLIHSRRYRNATNTGFTAVDNQMAVVAYVDIFANSGAGQVKALTFPNWRRMPQKTVSGAEQFMTLVNDSGNTVAIIAEYPRTSFTGYPGEDNDFQPYSYLTAESVALAGRGVIPRANVGCMWGGQLILGNVEWQSVKAIAANTKDFTISPNSILFSLTDPETTPYRSYMYYSGEDIDEFDPRAVLNVGTTDTTVMGMHVLNDTLIAITSAGGQGDGVITYRGRLAQLISYDPETDPNPFAMRREVLRGGLGGAPIPETVIGHRNFSTLWSEAGIVVFIDQAGGIWYTDGKQCDRLDRFGIIAPPRATIHDHVASIGQYLFAWRANRLLLFTLLTSPGNDGASQGCWTELVVPGLVRSLHGIGDEMYFITDTKVYRYAMAAPPSERGTIDGVQIEQRVSTGTIGEPDEHSRKHWHRFGMTFETGAGGAQVVSVIVKAGAARSSNVPATHIMPLNRTYTEGFSDFVVPAGIGSQPLVSATTVFKGYVRLQEASFWVTGMEPKR